MVTISRFNFIYFIKWEVSFLMDLVFSYPFQRTAGSLQREAFYLTIFSHPLLISTDLTEISNPKTTMLKLSLCSWMILGGRVFPINDCVFFFTPLHTFPYTSTHSQTHTDTCTHIHTHHPVSPKSLMCWQLEVKQVKSIADTTPLKSELLW